MTHPGEDVFPGEDLFPGGPPLSLQVAWGHTDLTTDPNTWDWTDITDDVRTSSGISWRFGRSDESSAANPAELTAVLNNPDHRYSLGGRSANFPYVRRNTPVRLIVTTEDGEHSAFLGFATSWEPSWESATGQIAVTKLIASGTLRRLAQGTDPVISPMYRYLTNEADVVAYWPCEEGKNSDFFPAAVGSQPMQWTGIADLASNTDFTASLPLPTMNGNAGVGASYSGKVDTYTPAADYSQGVRMCLSLPESGDVSPAALFTVDMTGGTVAHIQVVQEAAGVLAVYCYDQAYTTVIDSASATFNVEGRPGLISLEMYQSGGTFHYGLNFLPVGLPAYLYIEGDPSGTGTLGTISKVWVDQDASNSGIGFGHVAVLKSRSATDPLSDTYQQLNGYPNERITSSRLQRLCDENSINLTVYDGTSDALTPVDRGGSQPIDTVVSLLNRCQELERGVLWDGLTPGLAYTTRRRFENQTAALTIGADQLVAPFAPVDDDQRTRNRATVTREDGATFTYEDTDGPMGTDVVGVYPETLTVNSQYDAAARDIAGWLVHQGTVEGYRYPTVTLNLVAAPEIAGDVLDLIIGSRIDITGLDDILLSSADDTVSLVVEGISHSLRSQEWMVELTCSPYEVWRIGLISEDEDDTDVNLLRIDTSGSELTDDYTAGATSIVVDGELWTTETDDYPLLLDVAGVQVEASACTDPVTTGGSATVRDRASGVNDTASTSHSITLPSSVSVDDLLLVAFTNDVASVTASTVSTGWESLITRSQGSATTAQLGKTSDGASTSSSSANKTVVSKFTAASTGTVTAGHARLWVDTGTSSIEMVVYADSAGAPGSLLGQSDTLVVTNTSEALKDFTFTGANQASITSGTDYWIGFTWADPGTNNISWSRDATASSAQQNSSHAANPFGAATALSGPIDAYVDVVTPATNHTSTVFWKRATGSDALTVTTSASQESTHVSLSIYNAEDPIAEGADGGSASSGTAPDVTSLSGDYLGVVVVATDSSATTSQVVTPPSGFTNLQSRNPGITSSAATFTMEKSFTGISSISPGTFSLGTAEQWIAFTIAIEGTPAVVGTEQTFTVEALPIDCAEGAEVKVWKPAVLGL